MKKQPYLTGFPRTVFATAKRRLQARIEAVPQNGASVLAMDAEVQGEAVPQNGASVLAMDAEVQGC